MPNERLPNPELPVLDETLCTGCGACVELCPTDCLAMPGAMPGALPGALPWLPRPRECISCTLCVLICPASALHLAADDW